MFPVNISRRNQSFFDPPDLYPWYQVGVAMDDERQMSTLHPKQRGEHAGAICDNEIVNGYIKLVMVAAKEKQHGEYTWVKNQLYLL